MTAQSYVTAGKILANWDGISRVNVVGENRVKNIFYVGEELHIDLDIRLGNLNPEDVKVELLFADSERRGKLQLFAKYVFEHISTENGISHYCFKHNAKDVGLWDCVIRIIPQNPMLPHDLDFNLVKWM